MAYAEYEKDTDNIVLVSFDDPDSPVNVMNTNFLDGLDELLGTRDSRRGCGRQ
jgi:hypothetical protein